MLKHYLINTYGEVIQKKTTKLQGMKKQAGSAKCRWIFMCRCTDNNVLPTSFQTKPVLKTRKGYNLTREYNMKMLRATRDGAKQQYHQYLQKIREINGQLEAELSDEDIEVITRVTETSKENKYKKKGQR